jgi:hypothetical protein
VPVTEAVSAPSSDWIAMPTWPCNRRPVVGRGASLRDRFDDAHRAGAPEIAAGQSQKDAVARPERLRRPGGSPQDITDHDLAVEAHHEVIRRHALDDAVRQGPALQDGRGCLLLHASLLPDP